MARPRVIVREPDNFSPKAVARLQTVADVDLVAVPEAELPRLFQEYDVVWLRLKSTIDRQTIGDAPRCRAIAIPVTGLDQIDLEACASQGIEVLSLKGETEFLRRVRATSEMAVGLTLALIRKIPQAAASVKDGVWNRDLFEGRELFEKTVGIVGVGRLGSIVAEMYGAFGMRVIGYDPRPDFPAGIARVESLEALLSAADVVSIHAVLDHSTTHLIGAEQLARMKPTSVLINTARGGIVDEGALLEALTEGQIAGAALDVLSAEPEVSQDDPLIAYARQHDNLLIVPHIGGKTGESMEKTELFIADKVVELLS